FAKASNAVFEDKRYGAVCEVKIKGRTLVLLKPNTYMNLSGKAVSYWMQKEKVALEDLLVVVDDLALPFGALRLRAQGSDGGHNGLKNINALLGSTAYARLRFGIGNDFRKGEQIDYVLGSWDGKEREELPALLERGGEIIVSFVLQGVARTMNMFNTNKSKG
ncbi:MAG: aminoacyl-tRNA hydrolase, partial [Odoribacter sp.]|nr:aminoacyl-tRNA hydrolase [Odoribacter sp.]